MNFVIDIGNTNTKVGIFYANKMLASKSFSNSHTNELVNLIKDNPSVKKGIISSVDKSQDLIKQILNEYQISFICLDFDTKIPIINCYQSATLGNDRIASATGANYLYPGKNNLVIDCGTAITIDFVNKNNEFLGGNISPGLNMRFKALNMFSDFLPLVEKSDNYSLTGKTTEEAIINGIQKGIIFEINSYITEYIDVYGDINVVLTGGDSVFFENKLKNTIFVISNLTLIGLNRILEYNEEHI